MKLYLSDVPNEALVSHAQRYPSSTLVLATPVIRKGYQEVALRTAVGEHADSSRPDPLGPVPSETVRSSLHTPRREETTVVANLIAAVRNTGVRWARACGHAVTRLVEPARSAATATAGVARDSMRSRTQLLAENALLRQQLGLDEHTALLWL